jgi:E3 ubiquitin-protein ligase HERC2
MRRACAELRVAFAIGVDGELFSWGSGEDERLGHDSQENQPSPKRVEALRGVRVSSVAVGGFHALALSEDGSVYAWGWNLEGNILGEPDVKRQLVPKSIKALRGVRVSSVVVEGQRSYAVADTGGSVGVGT